MRNLKKEEVELRVKKYNNKDYEKATKAMLVIYKDARTDMALLDETYGEGNWQADYKDLKGVMYCGIGVRASAIDKEIPFTSEFVWKWNAGSESNTEKEKGEASDAFKRAGVLWGIGRELYKWKSIWVPYTHNKDKYGGFVVEEIEYKDEEPSKLIISNNRNEVVYKFGELRKESERVIKIRNLLKGQSKYTLESVQKSVFNNYKGKNIDSLTGQQYELVYNEVVNACMENA